MGLQSWTAHEHLKQDLKNIHLSLELALAQANLGETVFICPTHNSSNNSSNNFKNNFKSCQDSGANQLLIIQKNHSNHSQNNLAPNQQDQLLKIINLESKNTFIALKAFGEQDQFITLGPENMNHNFNQNFSLELVQENKNIKTGFTMSTLGDIQAIS